MSRSHLPRDRRTGAAVERHATTRTGTRDRAAGPSEPARAAACWLATLCLYGCGYVGIEPYPNTEVDGGLPSASAGDHGAVQTGEGEPQNSDPPTEPQPPAPQGSTDLCPDDATKVAPGECGCGVDDVDSDGDGALDCYDLCPSDATKTQPGVCGCGIDEADGDGDGTPDCQDACAADPDKVAALSCGCGVPETDSDSDAVADCLDQCSLDPGKTVPGVCGCSVPDEDVDGNGMLDCLQPCPVGSINMFPGQCGCDTPETDTDGDGSADCVDECDNDPNKAQPGQCGCSVPDTDQDGDGSASCNDSCDNDPAKTAPGLCGCGTADTDGDGDGEPDCLEDWYDPAWGYRQPVTLASASIAGNHAHFPVLIQATRAEWRSTGSGGNMGRANGGDIVFTSQDGMTQLDHEIESYDSATGSLSAWVKVPSLSAGTDTLLYVYFGNPSSPNQWNRAAVWDDGGAGHHRAVWHLDESGTSNRSDSTGNGNGCSALQYDGDEDTGGVAGSADRLDGDDDWLSCGSGASLDIRNALTVSAWVNLARRPDTDEWMNGPWRHNAYGLYVFGTDPNTTHLALDFEIDGDRHDVWDVGTIDLPPNQWHHLVLTYDGSDVRGYVNGQQDFTYSAPGGIDASAGESMTIGEVESEAGSLALDGRMDEVRVESTVRSVGWIRTAYRNLNAPGSFASVGALEADPF